MAPALGNAVLLRGSRPVGPYLKKQWASVPPTKRSKICCAGDSYRDPAAAGFRVRRLLASLPSPSNAAPNKATTPVRFTDFDMISVRCSECGLMGAAGLRIGQVQAAAGGPESSIWKHWQHGHHLTIGARFGARRSLFSRTAAALHRMHPSGPAPPARHRGSAPWPSRSSARQPPSRG